MESGRVSVSCEASNPLLPSLTECTLTGSVSTFTFACETRPLCCGVSVLTHSLPFRWCQWRGPGCSRLPSRWLQLNRDGSWHQWSDHIWTGGFSFNHWSVYAYVLRLMLIVMFLSTEPLLLAVNCTLGPEELTVVCVTSLDDTMVPISFTCSYDDGPAEECKCTSMYSTVKQRTSHRWTRSRDSNRHWAISKWLHSEASSNCHHWRRTNWRFNSDSENTWWAEWTLHLFTCNHSVLILSRSGTELFRECLHWCHFSVLWRSAIPHCHCQLLNWQWPWDSM